MLSSKKVTEIIWIRGVQFFNKSKRDMMLGGVIAGMFVSLASLTTYTVTCGMEQYFGLGITKLTAGIVFTFGLLTIVLSGSELFTGSMLHCPAINHCGCRTKILALNWTIIYFANFAGSLLVLGLTLPAGLFNRPEIAGLYVEISMSKVNLTFLEALIKGFFCNFLVCLAVRCGEAAEDVAGKIMAYIYVIGAFVINSFEHCVANMFIVPVGIALSKGSATEITWQMFLWKNLFPVTIGNILGGSFIGMVYYYLHRPDREMIACDP